MAGSPGDRRPAVRVVAAATLGAPHVLLRVVNVVEVTPRACGLLGETPEDALGGQRVTGLARRLNQAGRLHVQSVREHEVRDRLPGEDAIGVVAVAEQALPLSRGRMLSFPQYPTVAAETAFFARPDQNVGPPLMLAVALRAAARELDVVPLGDRLGVAGHTADIDGADEGSVAALALPLDGGMGPRQGTVHEYPLSPEEEEEEGKRQDHPRPAEHPVALNLPLRVS